MSFGGLGVPVRWLQQWGLRQRLACHSPDRAVEMLFCTSLIGFVGAGAACAGDPSYLTSCRVH